jgi:pentatricopeptide repeat protein
MVAFHANAARHRKTELQRMPMEMLAFAVLVVTGLGSHPMHPRQASDLVIRLSDLGLELDEASFTIAIVACNKARQYDTSLRLYQRMKDTVGEPQHPTAKEHGAFGLSAWTSAWCTLEYFKG